ncbi:hypothetical protein PAGU2638_12980 [Lysobacter sp. PAGU 2638]
MTVTIVGLVTPHVLRVIDLANQAEKGVNVDWHLRDAVNTTLRDLDQHYNGPALVAAYVEGLENAASNATKNRTEYARALTAAAAAARNPR